jgi:hypothetical protein
VLLSRDGNGRFGGVYQATGIVLNLASRIVDVAASDAIVCCADSYARMVDFYDAECMPNVKLKDFEPRTLWVLKTPKTNHEQFAVKIQSGLIPWTGRGSDLGILNAKLSKVVAGAGHCVVVTGHAGIGKTRLAFEYRRTLAPAVCMSLLGSCQTAVHDVAYLPVLESLKRALALSPELSDDLHERAVTAIVQLDRGLSAYLPHLLY